VTFDVNAAGKIGRIMFTTSAIQDRTFAIVHATETVTGYGAPVTIVVPSNTTVDVRQRVGGNVDEVLRSTAGDAPRSIIQADRHSSLIT